MDRDKEEEEAIMYILPEPKKITYLEGTFQCTYGMYVVMSRELAEREKVAGHTAGEYIRKYTGFDANVTVGEARTGDISLSVCEDMREEAYRIRIDENGVFICGGSETGVFWAVQTLGQILGQCGALLPHMEVEDEPERVYRGYYFDQTRGRILKLCELKKMVDQMCFYKLNQLQLYIEHTYLFRDFSELWRDQTPLGAQEILELDAYCRERHVELVPSIACFGHLYGLLSTRTYGGICEMNDSWSRPFSLYDRMRYHTVDVTDKRSFLVIQTMILEYMQLFETDKFNICADETFYLGKEKSRSKADEVGTQRLYIDFLKQLCGLIVSNGKIPMFWGDIICRTPELIRELPLETICLNWGYAADQREDETEKMAEAGATQYVCPGVCGWNEWMNLIENSYQNIRRMCTYGHKHGAIGVLNTDWGDFGHINEPAYSLPGMIYGAAFSWRLSDIGYEEMNRRISVIAYADPTQSYVSELANIAGKTLFSWRSVVLYYEVKLLGQTLNDGEQMRIHVTKEEMERTQKELDVHLRACLRAIAQMKIPARADAQMLSVTVDAIRIWNRIGYLLSEGSAVGSKERYEAASALEWWFMHFKDMWRKTGREGDLHRISDIVFWYADVLREKEVKTSFR